jgi:hypothetical protein
MKRQYKSKAKEPETGEPQVRLIITERDCLRELYKKIR